MTVVFAFVNRPNVGGYIASDGSSIGWQGLPHDLANVMEDVREKGEEVEEVSIGVDGDWFLRTDARHACPMENDEGSSNVENFVALAEEAGLSLEQFTIQFFTFVPDPTGYVTVLHQTDGSLTRCAWHNVPQDLDMVLEHEALNGVRHVTVGMNGSYFVLLNDGRMWWSGVPDSLHQLLDDASKGRGPAVVTVSLSLISDSWYFAEFADGTTKFFLPSAWHESINKITAKAMLFRSPKMSTSYNSAPSASHYSAPPQGQIGSFASRNPYALTTPAPGYIPFAANPHLAAAFTGMPQQQAPVYNVTNVYNNPMPETKKKKSTLKKYTGMFFLLGGALKLAGAVVAVHTGGIGAF